MIAAAPALPLVEGTFVAGEIDVPTPPPERTPEPSVVDFTAASSLLGQPEPASPTRIPDAADRADGQRR